MRDISDEILTQVFQSMDARHIAEHDHRTGALDSSGLMWVRSGPDFGSLGPGYVTEAVREGHAEAGMPD